MRITAYGDRLLDDLDRLDWPEPIKLMQRNWIGRSVGAHIDFRRSPTTRSRADPGLHHPTGHPVRGDLPGAGPGAPAGRRADPGGLAGGDPGRLDRRARRPRCGGRGYRRRPRPRPTWSGRRRARRRPASSPARTRPTRRPARRSRSSSPTTCWPGTAPARSWRCPAQDERDWEFAELFDLPIVRTVQPPDGFDGKAYTGDGPAINSAAPERDLDLDGLGVAEAKARDHRLAGGERARRRARSPTGCATGCSAGSATGVSRSRSSTTRPAADRAAGVDAAGRAARSGRLLAPDLRPGPTPTPSRRPRCRAAGTGWRSSWTWATGRSVTPGKPT